MIARISKSHYFKIWKSRFQLVNYIYISHPSASIRKVLEKVGGWISELCSTISCIIFLNLRLMADVKNFFRKSIYLLQIVDDHNTPPCVIRWKYTKLLPSLKKNCNFLVSQNEALSFEFILQEKYFFWIYQKKKLLKKRWFRLFFTLLKIFPLLCNILMWRFVIETCIIILR